MNRITLELKFFTRTITVALPFVAMPEARCAIEWIRLGCMEQVANKIYLAALETHHRHIAFADF
jgi:hypothetical protein